MFEWSLHGTVKIQVKRSLSSFLGPRFSFLWCRCYSCTLLKTVDSVSGKFSAQPHTIVKQICFPNGNVLFLSLFSLFKNWMHNVVWGCAEILPSIHVQVYLVCDLLKAHIYGWIRWLWGKGRKANLCPQEQRTIEIEIWIFDHYFIHKIQERSKGNCTAEFQIDNFHFGRAMFLRVTNCFVNISMF